MIENGKYLVSEQKKEEKIKMKIIYQAQMFWKKMFAQFQIIPFPSVSVSSFSKHRIIDVFLWLCKTSLCLHNKFFSILSPLMMGFTFLLKPFFKYANWHDMKHFKSNPSIYNGSNPKAGTNKSIFKENQRRN